jgi:predicted lipoprotein with Yx(FWY)xxD motif
MPFWQRQRDLTSPETARHRSSRSRLGALSSVGALCLLIAGCGSASSTSNSQPARAATTTEVATAAPTAARTPVPSSRRGATVKAGRTRYGLVLLDGRGRALYLFTSDRSPRSRCYGACAGNWPPFLTRGNPVPGTAAQASLLGTARRNDGSTQVTYRGHPLYYYVGDRHPGEVLCQDVEEFGGRWYVVTPHGSAVL